MRKLTFIFFLLVIIACKKDDAGIEPSKGPQYTIIVELDSDYGFAYDITMRYHGDDPIKQEMSEIRNFEERGYYNQKEESNKPFELIIDNAMKDALLYISVRAMNDVDM